MNDEEQYKKKLTEDGVDLPELKEEKKEEPKEPTKESPKEDEPEGDDKKPEGDDPEHLQEPKGQKKRSIYDEYKDKKSELKSERELREKAERERDELQAKFDAISDAPTKEDKVDATEDAIAYARKVGADPDLVQRIIEDARKGLKVEVDESLKKDIENFKKFTAQNQKVMEKQLFDDEFQSNLSAIKSYFPTAGEEELKAVKQKLEELSHTKDWHDKDLDYIAFKNQKELSVFVSPKKRGMENKGRKDVEEETFEFNPEADFSKMTPKQREEWEVKYRELGKTDGLITNANGKKIML
jgi:hypothetical protein